MAQQAKYIIPPHLQKHLLLDSDAIEKEQVRVVCAGSVVVLTVHTFLVCECSFNLVLAAA